jgi:hypothetical protein
MSKSARTIINRCKKLGIDIDTNSELEADLLIFLLKEKGIIGK